MLSKSILCQLNIYIYIYHLISRWTGLGTPSDRVLCGLLHKACRQCITGWANALAIPTFRVRYPSITWKSAITACGTFSTLNALRGIKFGRRLPDPLLPTHLIFIYPHLISRWTSRGAPSVRVLCGRWGWVFQRALGKSATRALAWVLRVLRAEYLKQPWKRVLRGRWGWVCQTTLWSSATWALLWVSKTIL